MDTHAPIDASGGYTAEAGRRYRFCAWIPAEAFARWLPWNAPGIEDMRKATAAAGWSDATLYQPMDARPRDWPPSSAGQDIPGDAYTLSGEGTWRGSSAVVPSVWPLPERQHAIQLAELWIHETAAPAPGPKPSPVPVPEPTKPGPPSSKPPAPRPAPAVTPTPIASASNGAGALALALGLGVVVVLASRRPRRTA